MRGYDGLDRFGKGVFQVHGLEESGTVGLRKQPRRDQMTAFFAICRRA